MSRRRTDPADSVKKEDPKITEARDVFEQKILARLRGVAKGDSVEKVGSVEDLMRSGRLQFIYNGTPCAIRSIRWTSLRNKNVGGIVTIKASGIKTQPIPFFLNEVEEKFQIYPEVTPPEDKKDAETGAIESDPPVEAEQSASSVNSDPDMTVDADEELGSAVVQPSPQEEIEALKRRIDELNKQVQQGVDSKKGQGIENIVLSSEDRIRELQNQKGPVLVQGSVEEGGEHVSDHVAKEAEEGVQGKQEQFMEFQRKTVAAKEEWEAAREKAGEAEQALQNLIKKRDGFFARIKRLFPKAIAASVGRVEYEGVDLGAFKEEINAAQVSYDSLRDKAQELEIAWEEAEEDEKDFMEKGKKEEKKAVEAIEDRYLNDLQDTIDIQSTEDILADGQDVLDGISKKLGWDGKTGEAEPVSDTVSKEVVATPASKSAMSEAPSKKAQWKGEEFSKVMKGDPKAYWETYLETVSPGEQQKLIAAQEKMMAYLGGSIMHEEKMSEAEKDRTRQLRWGRYILAAKSYGVGLKIEGKKFAEMWNAKNREDAARWLTIAVHRAGKGKLEWVLSVVGKG